MFLIYKLAIEIQQLLQDLMSAVYTNGVGAFPGVPHIPVSEFLTSWNVFQELLKTCPCSLGAAR